MDARPVYRCHYRACLREDAAPDTLAALDACRKAAAALVDAGTLMTAAIYHYGRQLFLYYEPIGEAFAPECFMAALHPFLLPWPEKDSVCDWALMYPVFWHAEPHSVDDWRRAPARERRRGRIAYLRHDTMFEYVYHHIALTQEGLLRGDQYMSVALHEDVLFSYFEEPRSSVNISGRNEASQAIEGWLATDPDSHFIHLPGSNGANFLLLPDYFNVGM